MSDEITSQEIVKADGSKELIHRDSLGKFVKGVSGNPKGKPKGSKSRTTIIKQAMEEALTRDAAEAFNDIVDQAISMARAGDKDMIKFVLGDILKEARRADPDEEENKKIGEIHIKFSRYSGEPKRDNAADAIDAEFKEIRDHIGSDNPPS